MKVEKRIRGSPDEAQPFAPTRAQGGDRKQEPIRRRQAWDNHENHGQSWAGDSRGSGLEHPGSRASLLPRDRLTKDDIYIFPEASNFLIYHLSAPEALPRTRDVCTHLMIPFAKQTSPSLRGNSLTLPRLLIPSINVTLSVARGIRGSCWHPAPRGSWGQFAGSSSQRGNHGNRPWRGC